MPILKNAKHEAFCQEYVSNKQNATQAYKHSGYKTKNDGTAKANACRLLTNDNIQNRIKELQKETETKELITREQLINDINNDIETARLNGQLSVCMKGHELRGKMIAAFTEKIEQKNSGDFKVVIFDGEQDIE